MYHRSSFIRFLFRCRRRHSRSGQYRHYRHFLCSHFSTTTHQSLELPLSHPTYIIWGSNTGVGKTLVSAGLAASTLLSSPSRFVYIKPIQTGFPSDSDSRFIFSKVCSIFSHRSSPFTLCASSEVFNTSESAENALAGSCNEDGRNGMCLSRWAEEKKVEGDGNLVSELVCKTIYAWKEAVSPHLAVEREGGAVKDLEVLEMLQRCLRNGMEGEVANGKLEVLSVIETAGGVASPGPSGSLQCDLYRPFRIPAILVGDGRLGGISGTISALETLKLRGYDVVAIILEDHGLDNEVPLMNYTRNKVPVLVLPPIPKDLSDDLMGWFDRSRHTFHNLKVTMLLAYGERIQRLHDMPKKARDIFWWPFTQHQLVPEGAVTVIDSRHGENFAVLKDNRRIAPMFDACASWWTQGPDATMQIELARDIGYAAARFGHVMFPENVYEPALECAELLLEGVGKGWASRTFFSDNGSTAIEIALKMAFRKFCCDHGFIPDSVKDSGARRSSELMVLALQGSYHGDTLGAMEAQAPSSYTGFLQQPWYTGRGLFLDPPTVFLHKGWIISLPNGLQSETLKVKDIAFASRDEIFHKRRDTSELATVYSSYISKQLSESRGFNVIGALLMEPVIQAAGGMHMVDPLFQRVLVAECRNRKIPVIFDEVFTGFWRLGVETAMQLIHCVPDIACYGKLLTGGTIPLAVTLATDTIFDSFMGDSKLKALLHGHSYSAHAMGCMAAAKSVKWFKDPCTNLNIISERRILRELWDEKLVDQFSSHHAVRRVVTLGTLFALELQAEGSNAGYGSLYARSLLRRLHQEGIYARPLGNVIYLMCGPCSSPETCRQLLIKLYKSLDEFAGNHMTENLVNCKAG